MCQVLCPVLYVGICLIVEETSTEKLSNLLKVTQPVSGKQELMQLKSSLTAKPTLSHCPAWSSARL